MKYIDKYLSQRCDYSLELPKEDFIPELIIVIPSYKETIEVLSKVIDSLFNQDELVINYAIFILVNTHEKDESVIKESSEKLYDDLKINLPSCNRSNAKVYPYKYHFSERKTGVGHARKLLMDLAFRWYQNIDKNGIIVNLDADTVVANNYISRIYSHFKSYQEIEAASIRYAHTIPDDCHPIIDYELHLRYFINMQRLIGLPFAYQTVGSAMAVRSDAYAKHGGMNKRQAGEDFYFLQKYAKTLTLNDINGTHVIPSPRASERVPFGTGKAVLAADSHSYNATSYDYASFIEIGNWTAETLKVLLSEEDKNAILPLSSCKTLNNYLSLAGYNSIIESIIENTEDQLVRYKYFFGWFNAFRLMKCLHYMRDNGYSDQPIDNCIKRLFENLHLGLSGQRIKNLESIRAYDKKQDYRPLDILDQSLIWDKE